MPYHPRQFHHVEFFDRRQIASARESWNVRLAIPARARAARQNVSRLPLFKSNTVGRSRDMLDISDAMWRLGAGDEVDVHAKELAGAAKVAQGWADGIERESGDAGK